MVPGCAARSFGGENGTGGLVRTHVVGGVAERRSGATPRSETRHSVHGAGTLPSLRRGRHHVLCSSWAATRRVLGVGSKAIVAPVRAYVSRIMLTVACAES